VLPDWFWACARLEDFESGFLVLVGLDGLETIRISVGGYGSLRSQNREKAEMLDEMLEAAIAARHGDKSFERMSSDATARKCLRFSV
jgi:hypothetical protein